MIEIETIAGRGHVKIRCVCDCAVGCHKGMIIAGNKTKKKVYIYDVLLYWVLKFVVLRMYKSFEVFTNPKVPPYEFVKTVRGYQGKFSL